MPLFASATPDDGERLYLTAAYVSRYSKLPKTQAVALLANHWVLTSTMKPGQVLKAGLPSVVLTYVGDRAAFYQTTRMVPKTLVQAATPQRVAAAAPHGQGYTCHATGITRQITITAAAHSCTSLYVRQGARQIVWRSPRDPNICRAKAEQFAGHLRALGVSCSHN